MTHKSGSKKLKGELYSGMNMQLGLIEIQIKISMKQNFYKKNYLQTKVTCQFMYYRAS